MTLQASQHNPALHQGPLGEAWPLLTSRENSVSIKAALDDVRRMPEFKAPEKDMLADLLKQPWIKESQAKLSQLMDQLLDAVARLLNHVHLPGANHLPENIRDLFSGVVSFIIVLFCLFIAYVILGWILRMTAKKPASLAAQEARLFEDTLLISSEHHADRAQHCAAQQNFSEGIRQWYLALLCLLDETQLIPFLTTRSNDEYQQLLKLQLAPAEADFIRLAKEFETVRYGHTMAQSEHYQHCATWYQRLQQKIQPHD